MFVGNVYLILFNILFYFLGFLGYKKPPLLNERRKEIKIIESKYYHD